MLFALIANDRSDASGVRLATRPEHLAYLKSLGPSLVFAGPFLNDSGQPDGSLVVVEADSQSAAEEIAANDPYARASLFETRTVRAWKWTLNNHEGR